MYKKILIIQFKPFGDIYLSTSYLNSLKNYFKNVQITYLTGVDFAEAASSHPLVNNVIPVRFYRGFLLYCNVVAILLRIRFGHYNIVIDQQNSTASRLITVLSGSDMRVGWAGRRWESHLDVVAQHPQGTSYAAERNISIAKAIGVKDASVSMNFSIKNGSTDFVNSFLNKNGISRKKFITIAPGSKDPKKQWHSEGYINACKLLIEQYNHPIVVLYAPYEHAAALAIVQSFPEKVYLAPRTTLNQVVAFIEASRILICNDCALNHLSTATSTPAIGIFGNSSPELWSPANTFSKHRHLHNPQWIKNDTNDFGISPAEVVECFKSLINSGNYD